jgi:thiol-disulfide isomerase/thioredoxin
MNRFILFILLFYACTSLCQNQQPLSEGSNAPPLSVLKWVKGTAITSFEPDHLYMIEFGATWCKPCAEAIPELAAIQSEFNDKVSIASIFVMEANKGNDDKGVPSYVSVVERYIAKKSSIINYAVAIDSPERIMEKSWLKAAELSGIPYIFLIDGKGVIQWIGSNPIKAKNALISLIENKEIATVVQSPKYDKNKLLLIDDNGGRQTDFVFRSILTFFDGKVPGNSAENIVSYQSFKPDSIYDQYEDKWEVIGRSVGKLYYMAYADTLPNKTPRRVEGKFLDTVKMPYVKKAYGKYWHVPILEVSDKELFEASYKSTRNRFNYSLKVPKGTGSARFMQQTMQRDLATYFGFDVEVQIRQMPYWKISVANRSLVKSKLISKDQKKQYQMYANESPYKIRSADMRDVVAILGGYFGFGVHDYGKVPLDLQAAFVDETSINENIDFDFDPNWSFDECKKQFQKYGLEISRDLRNTKVVVIKDPKPNP